MRTFLAVLILSLALGLFTSLPAQQPAALSGRVVDSSGAVLVGASVTLRPVGAGTRLAPRNSRTTSEGIFSFENVAPGEHVLVVEAPDFQPFEQRVRVSSGETRSFDVRLSPATLIQEVVVSAQRLAGSPEAQASIPGSVSLLTSATLAESRVITLDEALRKVPGVYARAEEGLSLRPNIGIRGLNPTRSSKVLLLEDGVPLSYAPYGDNASYYHPPVDRYESLEVLKGAGQILYGPMTVGGVINYVTPPIPEQPAGSLSLAGGTRDYLNGHLNYGGTFGKTGVLVDAMRKQGEGSRENLRSGLNDLNVKGFRSLGATRMLSLKANYYTEDSNITYSGLRESEFLANPRGNAFRNDFFFGNRWGLAALYSQAVGASTVLNANIYGARFRRHWWRQSSNSGQRPNDSADPACGGMANLNTTCGNEGRLREYHNWGIEPRIKTTGNWLGVRNDADFGVRVHFEDQDRIQKNGDIPTARDGRIVEDNERFNRAYSAFVQNRFVAGRFAVTPGLRVERVRFERRNLLTGASGETNLTQVIPGIGVSFSPSSAVTVFSGLHRGFSPPRTEDIITNAGGTIDLDPELSWNFEVGARARLSSRLSVEGTFFRMDYENQIVPASVAGGLGATATSAGETLHQGFEAGGRWEQRSLAGSRHGFYVSSAVTWLPVARFAGTRFSSIPGFTSVRVTGNRLPYAPTYLLTTGFGYTHASGLNGLLEASMTGRQFGDDLNTVNPTPDGQRGAIPGNTTWNATVNYPVEAVNTTLFVSVKNLFDRTSIVDRTRGVLPNMPRTMVAGLKFRF